MEGAAGWNIKRTVGLAPQRGGQPLAAAGRRAAPPPATQAGSMQCRCRGTVRGHAAQTYQGRGPEGGALLEEGLTGTRVVQWLLSQVARKTNERAAGRARGLELDRGLAVGHWGRERGAVAWRCPCARSRDPELCGLRQASRPHREPGRNGAAGAGWQRPSEPWH